MKTFQVIGIMVIVLLVFAISWVFSKGCGVADKVTDPEHIISSYEEYENIYNTCKQICTNIQTIQNSKEDNVGGFSKEQRIVALQNQLSRWVNEYNSKSKQITRNMWKSSNLPYQLNYETICNQ